MDENNPIVFVMLLWFYLIKYFKIDGDFAGSKEVINHETKLLANFQAMKSVSRFYFYGVGMDFQKRY
jgi:hypothetical protein